MKNYIKLISLIIVVLMLCSCGEKSERTQYFSERMEDYSAIVYYLREHYADYSKNDDKEYSANLLKDMENIQEIKDSVYVAGKDFEYVWIAKDYVIFWNDETKKVGLLNANNPNLVITDMKKWYSDMEYEKINDSWYTIGTWKH